MGSLLVLSAAAFASSRAVLLGAPMVRERAANQARVFRTMAGRCRQALEKSGGKRGLSMAESARLVDRLRDRPCEGGGLGRLLEGYGRALKAAAGGGERALLVERLGQDLTLLADKLTDVIDRGCDPLGPETVRLRLRALLRGLDPPKAREKPVEVGGKIPVVTRPGKVAGGGGATGSGAVWGIGSGGAGGVPSDGGAPSGASASGWGGGASSAAGGQAPSGADGGGDGSLAGGGPSPRLTPGPRPAPVKVVRPPTPRPPEASRQPSSPPPRLATTTPPELDQGVRSAAVSTIDSSGGGQGPPRVLRKPLRSSLRDRDDPGRSFAFYGAPILLFVIAVVLVFVAVRRRLKRARKGAVRSRLKKEGIIDPEHVALDGPALRGVATAARVRRDWLKALRYLWASLLVQLEASNLLRFDPAATNLELVGALRAQGTAVSLFGRIAGAFDLHFYGKVPVTEGDYAAVVAATDDLRARLGLEAASDLHRDERKDRVDRVLGEGVPS